MSDRPPAAWLPRLLFRLTAAAAGLLFLAVLASPWLDGGAAPADGWSRLVALFARDATVRRTAVCGGAGLLATAFIFFRQPSPPGAGEPARPPRTTGGIGA